MNSVTNGLITATSSSPVKIPLTHFLFFWQQSTSTKYFKKWLILTAKSLLQSAELHGSPVSWEPDVVQVSWREKGETEVIGYFTRKHRRKRTVIGQQPPHWPKYVRTESSCICPKFGDIKTCQCGEMNENLFFSSLTMETPKFCERLLWYSLQGMHVILAPEMGKEDGHFFPPWDCNLGSIVVNLCCTRLKRTRHIVWKQLLELSKNQVAM